MPAQLGGYEDRSSAIQKGGGLTVSLIKMSHNVLQVFIRSIRKKDRGAILTLIWAVAINGVRA